MPESRRGENTFNRLDGPFDNRSMSCLRATKDANVINVRRLYVSHLWRLRTKLWGIAVNLKRDILPNFTSKHLSILIASVMMLTTQALADGWMDWVPKKEKTDPYCNYNLVDLLGASALATSSVAASGLSVTTTTISPTIFLVAGESSLMAFSGKTVSVVTAPVVGSAATVAATTVSVGYLAVKGVCFLSDFTSSKFITNEPIPLVMDFSSYKWGVSDAEGYKSGEYRFVETDEVIAAGTPVFSLGPLSEAAAAYYPNYNGRGLVRLGQFFDHVYESEIPEEERGFVVVPANSLNPIYIEKYTHIFVEDTIVVDNREPTMLPAGTPFQLLKVREDGWAKIELTDGFNKWVEAYSFVKVLEIDRMMSAVDR